MADIEFTANLHGIKKKVELSNPYGGGEGYHVYIDRYYYGTIVKLKGQWVGHMNPKSDLTEAQIQKMGKIIDEHEGL